MREIMLSDKELLLLTDALEVYGIQLEDALDLMDQGITDGIPFDAAMTEFDYEMASDTLVQVDELDGKLWDNLSWVDQSIYYADDWDDAYYDIIEDELLEEVALESF